MTVRRLSLDAVETMLDWAAAERWNPGLDDAAAFHAADPDGFFVKEVAGRPVAAVCVVNHTPDFAFLGLYIAAPQARGQGHGLEVWTAALEHAGSRCVGLDGVPQQQANYRKSGFVLAGKTVRYQGSLPHISGSDARLSSPEDLPDLCVLDRMACGFDRRRFAEAWLQNTATRQTVLLPDGKGFATFRLCRSGVKIGPFLAHDAASADALLNAIPFGFPGGEVYIDVPDSAAPLTARLRIMGFTPVFETARMYRPAAPDVPRRDFYATATLELG
ncbi:GNAT family N-acetyltransferase [Tropicibacter sp. S64]|uniref:GNAT family N-acetyltransferase n=1 Tax=Tropicibacter sp. S64 TaxID=3415122 RepID=UPI003C7B3A70